MEHPVDATIPTSHITRESIENVLARCVGDIEQVPPSYSACKINGNRAYELKRKGKDVELTPKNIHIDSIELTDFDEETMRMGIRVNCGKGTYIRALARDIGRALGSGAYLTMLCRTRVGEFTIDRCLDLDEVEEWLENQEIENIE